MAEYRPGTEALAWIQTQYSKKIHVNAYNKMRVGKNFKDLNEESQGGKPGQTFNWFTHANLSRTSLTSTSSLVGLTFQANNEVAISGTASALIIPVQVNQLTINRMMMDPRNTLRDSMERSLAEGVDNACTLLAASLGTSVVGSNLDNITKSLASQAGGKLATNAKEYWAPGEAQAWFYYAPSQYQFVQNTLDWTAAQYRGDAENPNVSGVVNKANGLTMVMSPTVYSSGGVAYNFIQTEFSHGLGYNQRITVKVQDFDAAYKLIGLTDFMAMELKDEYAVLVQTAA